MGSLALERVSAGYSERSVLTDFSLEVASGEVVALLGPSGSGKTTALRILLGFLAPARGSVRIGADVASRDGEVLVPPEGRGLGVVFQDLALWPHLTVAGNLGFGLAARHVPRQKREARIHAMLERVGLANHAGRYPGELSGGERQRVAIARALVLEPQAVLLDEPLTNLDVSLKRELLRFFRELLEERGATALYVTHDLREAAALADRIGVIEAGRIAQLGSLDVLRARPASAFVGALFDDAGWMEEGRQAHARKED